ncbi:hypothetical protein LIER_04099 [Lithospermum erythrorhizon]|uniref:Uncharacterized protein n=1 Tax=Lithospermum erythrorhizon TaxID=34254 RepID=A0AAV3NYB3_LITER
MHSTSITFNPLAHHPFSSNFARKEFSFPYNLPQDRPNKINMLVVNAKKRDAYDGKDRRINHGRLVDEDMIVLRMRIRDMKMSSEVKNEAPWYWMEWEKKWYEKYDSDICEAMGMLQRFLMDARPGLVVGLLALVMLSVSTSSAFVLGHLLGFLG